MARGFTRQPNPPVPAAIGQDVSRGRLGSLIMRFPCRNRDGHPRTGSLGRRRRLDPVAGDRRAIAARRNFPLDFSPERHPGLPHENSGDISRDVRGTFVVVPIRIVSIFDARKERDGNTVGWRILCSSWQTAASLCGEYWQDAGCSDWRPLVSPRRRSRPMRGGMAAGVARSALLCRPWLSRPRRFTPRRPPTMRRLPPIMGHRLTTTRHRSGSGSRRTGLAGTGCQAIGPEPDRRPEPPAASNSRGSCRRSNLARRGLRAVRAHARPGLLRPRRSSRRAAGCAALL